VANDSVDVIVLGMGVGGEAVAAAAAEAGLQVIGIDERLVGGECAYWGCIPTKIIVRGANLLAEARRGGFNIEPEERPEWDSVRQRVRAATADWDDTEAVRRFEGKGGRFVRGAGRLTANDTVEVDGKSYRATRAVVIASGTSPVVPDIPGLDDVPFWTNRDAVETPSLPESIVVLGGGTIGVEFAQAWQRLGTQVTVIETGDCVLSREEPEASTLIAEVLRSEGIDVRTGVTVERVEGDEDGVVIHLSNGLVVRAAELMIATGRSASLRDLGVAHAGLDEEAKSIEVDEHLRAAPGIWAVGDVTGKGAFTHIATYQADIAAADILGRPTPPASYHAVPRVTFTDPEVGAVGMTEKEAKDIGRNVQCATTDIAKSSRGFVHGDDNRGLIKLVVDADTHTLIGATSVGPMGGEVLSVLTLAVHARITTDVLREMIYAYPTFHRAILDALGKL